MGVLTNRFAPLLFLAISLGCTAGAARQPMANVRDTLDDRVRELDRMDSNAELGPEYWAWMVGTLVTGFFGGKLQERKAHPNGRPPKKR